MDSLYRPLTTTLIMTMLDVPSSTMQNETHHGGCQLTVASYNEGSVLYSDMLWGFPPLLFCKTLGKYII